MQSDSYFDNVDIDSHFDNVDIDSYYEDLYGGEDEDYEDYENYEEDEDNENKDENKKENHNLRVNEKARSTLMIGTYHSGDGSPVLGCLNLTNYLNNEYNEKQKEEISIKALAKLESNLSQPKKFLNIKGKHLTHILETLEKWCFKQNEGSQLYIEARKIKLQIYENLNDWQLQPGIDTYSKKSFQSYEQIKQTDHKNISMLHHIFLFKWKDYPDDKNHYTYLATFETINSKNFILKDILQSSMIIEITKYYRESHNSDSKTDYTICPYCSKFQNKVEKITNIITDVIQKDDNE